MGRHSKPRTRVVPQRRPEYGADELYVAELAAMSSDAPTVPFPAVSVEDREEIGLDIFFERTQDARDRYEEINR